jgi:hypothetical protein
VKSIEKGLNSTESGPSVLLVLLNLVRPRSTRPTYEVANASIVSTSKTFLVVTPKWTRNVRVTVFVPIVHIPAAPVLKILLRPVDAIAKATLLHVTKLTRWSVPSTGTRSTGAILISVARRSLRSVLGLRCARSNCHTYCEGPCCDLRLRCHPFLPFRTPLHTTN